jgi:hypothetical protein
MAFRWFALLVSSICLEGLGRKYLSIIPSAFFYFLKDIVLVAGILWLRFNAPKVQRTAKGLYRGFAPWLIGAMVWTALEVFNPENPSMLLGFMGLRAYWLWWLAPVAIASSLRNPQVKRRAIYFLAILSVGISVLGALQFSAPPDSTLNMYASYDQELYASPTATVAATGRARVSGTFSFLSGFASFTVLVPALLLSLGMEAKDRRVRTAALVATMVCASVLPMSGSRSSVVIGGAVLLITAWTAGLFFTKAGRRVLIGAIVAAVLAVVAFPQALEGVESRFEAREETMGRIESVATVLPPVALSSLDYPMGGLGTGMQQNFRVAVNVTDSKYVAEIAAARYLIELGPIGYLLVWVANLGLMVALVRASSILKRGGRRASAGAALSYAVLALVANTAFDHITQALFFLGCGFILSEVQEVVAAMSAQATQEAPPVAVPR